MILPSNELLGEVLGKEVISVTKELDGKFDPCILVTFKDEVLLLNIYELMYLMKEWAYTKNINGNYINIHTSISKGISGRKIIECRIWSQGLPRVLGNMIINSELVFEEGTEPEAVTKVCEWLLKEYNE